MRLKAFLIDLKFNNGQGVRGGWVWRVLGWGRKAPLTCRRLFLSGIHLNSNSYEKQSEEPEAVSVFILFQRTYILGESSDQPD